MIKEDESEEEREKEIQRFMKRVLKFLKEHKCLSMSREISESHVLATYGSVPQYK